jgi:SAM-dependent methyltransferase
MVDDPRCIQVPTTQRGKPEDTGLETASADLVIIPNLVHHVANQPGLFNEISRILKPGGRGYIFEPLVREIHQDPDDYVRYTPAGFRKMIESAGMMYDQTIPEGGPFTAVAYCWSQALEYIPEPERSRIEEWFYGQHFQDLLRWDALYPRNLKRKHTSFPTAFGIYFRKAN